MKTIGKKWTKHVKNLCQEGLEIGYEGLDERTNYVMGKLPSTLLHGAYDEVRGIIHKTVLSEIK